MPCPISNVEGVPVALVVVPCFSVTFLKISLSLIWAVALKAAKRSKASAVENVLILFILCVFNPVKQNNGQFFIGDQR
ncbi:hypothetical protein D3C85_1483150 [compost metagenome]